MASVQYARRVDLRWHALLPAALAGFAGSDMARGLGNPSGALPFSVVFGLDGTVLHRKLDDAVAGLRGRVVLALVVLALRPWLPGWYGEDARVIALISSALLVLAVLQPLSGVVFALDGVLIGAGDTRWLAWAQIVVLLAFLPAAWLVLVNSWSLDALWWALGWFLLVRAVLLVWRARGSAWLITGAVRPR